jgi:hypothetical protein
MPESAVSDIRKTFDGELVDVVDRLPGGQLAPESEVRFLHDVGGLFV